VGATATFSRTCSLVLGGVAIFMFFHETNHSRQGIWSFRSEKVSFFDTIFALRPEGFRHASNWQGPGAAI